MFENDNWMFDDAFDDIDENEMYLQCQNEEKAFTKRRKIDDKDLCFRESNTSNSKLNTAQEPKDKKSSSNINSNISRGNLLLGIFQESTCQNIPDVTEEINKNSSYKLKQTKYQSSEKNMTLMNLSSHKGSKNKECFEVKNTSSSKQAELCKKMKFVRLFPGPAGLVAPMKNDNVPITSYLNNLKKLEDKRTTTCVETNFSKLSQDEKLFDEKAWKLLLDDLPSNFLNEYRISNIKNKANGSHCDSMKVKFIAGILDYVDHSHDDPFIILKDSTDSIEGTVHRDILLNHPHILEPNIAILLCDVGLLKTTTYVVRNKYHILISKVNLLAVYSDKGCIIRTSRMKEVSSSISNVEITEDYCITPVSNSQAFNEFNKPQSIDNECDTIERTNSPVRTSADHSKPMSTNSTTLLQSNGERDNSKQASEKDSKNCEAMNTMFDDGMNDIFFALESDLIALSPEAITQTSKIQNASHLESTREKSVRNLENKVENACLLQASQKHDTSHKNYAFLKSKNSTSIESKSAIQPSYSCKKSCDSDIKHKTSSGVKYNTETSKSLISYFTGGAPDNEFDSGDEILSQLDI